jgi:hypothetical protein
MTSLESFSILYSVLVNRLNTKNKYSGNPVTFMYEMPYPCATPLVPENFSTISLSWVSFFVLLNMPFYGNYTLRIRKFFVYTFYGIRSYSAESLIPRMKDVLIWPSNNRRKLNLCCFSFCSSLSVLLISHTKNREGSLSLPILNSLLDLSLMACNSS